jgi:hypothetical protein
MRLGNDMKLLIFVLLANTFWQISCVPKSRPNFLHILFAGHGGHRETNIVVIPGASSMPSHMLFSQTDRYQFSIKNPTQFKKEIILDPLMHDVRLSAQIMSGNKVVKKYLAVKSMQNTLSDKKTTWTAGRTKLALTIPYVAPNQEVVISTSYTWMDPRWTWPVFLEATEPTISSRLTIDVPFGIALHYRAAKNQEAIPLIPDTQDQNDKVHGPSTRYLFDMRFNDDPVSKNPSERSQIYFSFELPSERQNSLPFNNWSAISSYLYDRIDRYDLASMEIRDFTLKECSFANDNRSKILKILSFLENSIEKKAALGSFLEQEAHPAMSTFTLRLGSHFDTAILGTAMLRSIGIPAGLFAVAVPEQNPRINDFFSPALFYKVMLLIKDEGRNLYWDPGQPASRLDRVPLSLQGQNALLLQKDRGTLFKLPYLKPEDNESRFVYELSLSPNGQLNGSFSLDLINLGAERAQAMLLGQKEQLSARVLQNNLNFGDDALFWQIASLTKNDQHSINISGQVMADQTIDNNANLSMAISDIFKPALLPLLNAEQQQVSSNTTVQARIKLPKNYKVEHLPFSEQINSTGLFGHFSVSQENDYLIFFGTSTVLMPLLKAPKPKLANHIRNLENIRDQKLLITSHDQSS